MTVDISISRPPWAGGRPSDKEKALILKAVNLIKDHENQHAAIAKQMFTAAVCGSRQEGLGPE
jgi:predicted secreted Zn-dependent protease